MKMTHSKKQIFANLNNCGSFVYATNRLNGEALAIGNPASIAFTPPLPADFQRVTAFYCIANLLNFPVGAGKFRNNFKHLINILI